MAIECDDKMSSQALIDTTPFRLPISPEAFDISMMEAPVTGKTFASPMPGANWNLSGYKAYVSINRADAGLSFGPVKLTINLS
jgi:hypothetical protein